MPDYEEMILARQEEREILEDECSGDCDYCPYRKIVRYAERIDREPEYICGLFEEDI